MVLVVGVGGSAPAVLASRLVARRPPPPRSASYPARVAGTGDDVTGRGPAPARPRAQEVPPGEAPPRLGGRWWLALAVLVLPLVSDWKVRARPVDESISGSPDLFVVLEVAVYGAVAVLLALSLPRDGRRRRLGPVLLLWWTWVAVAGVSAAWSPYGQLAVVRAGQLVVLALVVHVAARRATRADLHRLTHAYLGLCVVACGLGLVYAPEVSRRVEGRFHWLLVHPVVGAVWLGLGLVAAYAYAVAGRAPRPGPRWPTWVYGLLAGVVGAGLLATGTRGAAVAVVLALVVVTWAAAPRRRRLDVLAAGAVLGGLGWLLLSGAVSTFLVRDESTSDLTTLNYRTELWSRYADLWREQPLLGYGLGATRGLLLDETGLGGGHNAYVGSAVDTGVVGLALWTALLVAAVAAVATMRGPAARTDRALLLGVAVVLGVGGLTTELLSAPANVAVTWLGVLVAWPCAAERSDPTRPTSSAAASAVPGQPTAGSRRRSAAPASRAA